MFWTFCLFSVSCFPFLVRSAPDISSLGVEVTLLVNNDILANESPDADSGVLLLSSRTYQEAVQGCRALGEELWSPSLKTSSIQPNLNYLAYEGKYSSTQQYWTASSTWRPTTINGKGEVQSVNPNQTLPALCTQTAPFSNWTYQDTDPKWQITVESNNEYLTGFRDRLSFRFLGVRYAPEPERFAYSTLYKGAGQNVSATAYGSECMQKAGGSEDCLFLNIWTPYLPANPAASRKDLKPVMFFIYGGGYTTGTGNDPTFDGANLASRGDIVAVAINYRVTTFGFLVLDDGVTNGNFGFADAITALDWVIENIEDFGGDPDRITIFGQSAGAATVRAMLASPKAIGKFNAAIPQSNLGGLKDGTYSLYRTIAEELETTTNTLLQEANCTNATSQLACLRALPASTLIGLHEQADTLTVDGTYLTTDELVLNGSAPVADVHLMMGVMRDEGGSAIGYPTSTNFSSFIASEGFNATLVLDAGFPIPNTGNATLDMYNASVRVDTDGEWRCVDQATVYAGVQNDLFKSVYFYEFNRSYALYNDDPFVCNAPTTPGIFVASEVGNPDLEYFKCHAADLYFTFGTIGYNGLALRDENDLRFEQFIVDTWTSFARTYDPNPDPAFLRARGFTNTTLELNLAGTWDPLSKDSFTLRELQWPSLQMDFRDLSQCANLGYPLDYYLSH